MSDELLVENLEDDDLPQDEIDRELQLKVEEDEGLEGDLPLGIDYIRALNPLAVDYDDVEPDVDESENYENIITAELLPDVRPAGVEITEPPFALMAALSPQKPHWARGIPLSRKMRLGTKGIDVVGVKRGLSRAGYMEWGEFNELYGENMVRAVKAFQGKRGIPQSGVYGPATHDKLALAKKKGTKQWAFTNYEDEMLTDYLRRHAITPEQRMRTAIRSAARFWIAAAGTQYSQARPFSLVRPPSVPSRGDCSGYATRVHYAGGARNPNVVGGRRLSYASDGGQGYTGSLMGGGSRCGQSQLRIGDLIFYGYTRSSSPAFSIGDPTHVAVVINLHPLIVGTHGSGVPAARVYNYRSDINHYRHYVVA